MPTLEDDGWELESAEERHAAAPATFHIPSAQERRSLGLGQMVKLLFLFMNEENGKPIIDCERMWVTVTAETHGRYTGRLESLPSTSSVLQVGHVVEFGPEHVSAIQISRTDPRHPDYAAPTTAAALGSGAANAQASSPSPIRRRWWEFWR